MNQSKWLYAFLLISLATNIFVVGYFVGKPQTPSVEQTTLTTPLTQDMKGMYKVLPEENKKKLAEYVKQQQQEIIINQNQIRQVRLQISQVLVQEPLNEKLLGELFEQTYALSIKNYGLAQKTIFQIIIKLPKEEREKVAKALAAQALRKPAQKPKPMPDKTL